MPVLKHTHLKVKMSLISEILSVLDYDTIGLNWRGFDLARTLSLGHIYKDIGNGVMLCTTMDGYIGLT